MQANVDFSFRCVENSGSMRLIRIVHSAVCGLGIHTVREGATSDVLSE